VTDTDRSTLVDVDAAQVTRGTDGMIVVDDPAAPVIVSVRLDTSAGRPVPSVVMVQARHPGVRISAAMLSRLPLAQIIPLAAATNGSGHPDEPYYRQLARPKPRGQRASWDPGHWDRVLAVYEWALRVDRPGGGGKAVADFWGVTVNPTVYRWLKIARTRKG
jgi:hypothetical protein